MGPGLPRGVPAEERSPAGADETAATALAPELHLRDGRTVSVRAVTGDDEAAIWDFLTDLSIESRRLRFFSVAIDLRAQARRDARGEDADHHGVLAIAPGRGIAGHAIYVRLPRSERAEVAVEVAEDFHHLGLATLLVIRLAESAGSRRITHFFAEVLPENHDMLAVFRDGFAAVTRTRQGVVEVEFPTSSWAAAHARFEP
jgi:acetate---CoA ligase (ADP-forming)